MTVMDSWLAAVMDGYKALLLAAAIAVVILFLAMQDTGPDHTADDLDPSNFEQPYEYQGY